MKRSGQNACSKRDSPRDRSYCLLFENVCSMEDDIASVENFADAIAIMSESIDGEPMALSIQRLAWEIKRRIRGVEARRGKLFHMTHPRRQHFEREGWPG